MKTETPLDDALTLWKPLERHAARRVETWTKGYEIYVRKGEQALRDWMHYVRPEGDGDPVTVTVAVTDWDLGMYLAALRCLNEAAAIEKDSPDLHRQIIHFQRTGKLLVSVIKEYECTAKLTCFSDISRSPQLGQGGD